MEPEGNQPDLQNWWIPVWHISGETHKAQVPIKNLITLLNATLWGMASVSVCVRHYLMILRQNMWLIVLYICVRGFHFTGFWFFFLSERALITCHESRLWLLVCWHENWILKLQNFFFLLPIVLYFFLSKSSIFNSNKDIEGHSQALLWMLVTFCSVLCQTNTMLK